MANRVGAIHVRKLCEKFPRYGSLPYTVGDHMVSINEELELAKAAKGAVKALLTATYKPAVLATLKDAYRAAVLNLSSGGGLNAARAKVGIALSNIMHGMPTKEKFNEVTSAIDVWITELESSL
jgi:hypothetical protein